MRKINLSKLNVPIEQFLKIETPNVAYLLGLFWADGNLYKNNLSLRNLADDIKDILRIFNATGKWSVYPFHYKNRKPSIHVSTNSRMLAEFLTENDYRVKSITKPSKILSKIPDDLHKYFWRGYFDGDGTIKKQEDSYTVSICSNYEQDWSEHVKLFHKLQINHKIKQEKYTSKTGKIFSYSKINIYRRDDALRFLSYIYSGYENDKIGLARKYMLFKIKEKRANK